MKTRNRTFFGYLKMFGFVVILEILLELVGYQLLGRKLYGLLWTADGPNETVIHLAWLIAVNTPVLLWWMTRELRKENRYVHALRDKENEFQSLFDHNSEAIVAFDVNGNITRANPAFLEMSGYSPEELQGQHRTAFVSRPNVAKAQEHFTLALQGMPQEFENILMHKNDQPIYIQSRNIPIYKSDKVVGVYAIIKDITDAKRHEIEMWNLAYRDHLTDLPNRRLFISTIEQSLVEAKKRNGGVGVLFVDLDRFKAINDSLGHDIGDQVLKTITGRMSRVISSPNLLARLGGDEFALLLPNVQHVDEAAVVAEQLLRVIEEPIEIDGYEFYLTSSIGISTYPVNGESTKELLRSADTAMYEAKRAGKNIYRIHMPSMNRHSYEKLRLESDLKKALENDGKGLFLEYQPQVDVHSGQVVRAEALIRWQHPQLGRLGPDDFIPLAEETGLILPLGEFVLRQVCNHISEWNIKSPQYKLPVAINASSLEFQSQEFVPRVKRVIQASGVDPSQIAIEVTETTLMKNEKTTAEKMNRLRELGVKIYVDDFGKGFSSLGFLKNFPLDGMKIDRMFISEIDSNDDDRSIVSALVTLAHSRRLQVTAEGVERSGQLDILQNFNCDDYQGYLFSHPISDTEFFHKYYSASTG